MTQTVFVTGASGYIARHILVALLNADYRVTGSLRDAARGNQVRDAIAPALQSTANLDDRLSFVSLDLASDAGWDSAMTGADALMHTASPFPMVQPKDPQQVIRPAVDGALRALRAAQQAGIDRVIMTSSTVAIAGCDLPPGDSAYDERHWTDTDRPGTSPYAASKTLAERAAWDFVANSAPGMRLTTVNPGFVVGPPLGDSFGTSVGVIARLLRAKDPMLPRLGFGAVDVADIAALHMAALERPETEGQRIMGSTDFLWFTDLARAVKDGAPRRRIVKRQAPDWVVRVLALFDPAIRGILPDLGRSYATDAARARALLGRDLHDPRAAVAATARYLDAQGLA